MIMYTASLHECRDYKFDKIKELLKSEINELGGITNFVKKGDRVLLKPNLVMVKTPERAATTHPYIVRAVAEIVKEAGGEPIIADSPGGLFNEVLLKSVYSASGMTEAASLSGAKLNYNTATAETAYPDGKLLRKITVIDELLKADKVINISKLKTHGMMRMTGAVKNLFGTIPGTMKAEYHLNRPNVADFANALIDICLFAKPVLNIMDAVIGMEGNGPTGGTPRNIGVLMTADNPFVLDIMAAYLIDIQTSDIPVCEQAIKRGLSPESIDEIKIIGDSIHDFVVSDFKAPKSKVINITEKLPKPLYRVLNDVLQPYPHFDHSKCVSCRHCEENCPPHAIEMIDGKPVFTKNKCIRCFCCQELCPAIAIEIKRPVLYKIFSSL
ncbi:MAG: DUF362 domain-containing protein [Candidatus Metalachnospira sp.]|nr:DUF362 domain-containing protein [Candidatus Metalachnospira sp.]